MNDIEKDFVPYETEYNVFQIIYIMMGFIMVIDG